MRICFDMVDHSRLVFGYFFSFVSINEGNGTFEARLPLGIRNLLSATKKLASP